MSDKRVIQAPTPHEYQYKDLASWLKEDMTPADTVLFITEKDFSSSVGDNLKGILDSLHITCNRFSYTILEGRDVLEPLTALMTATGVNRVVIGSDNEAFVNDVKDALFGNSAKKLFSFLVQNEDLSEDEIVELLEMIKGNTPN